MARGDSARVSRLVRGGFIVLSLTVFATGLVILLRDRSAPAQRQRPVAPQQDAELAAYGRRITVPPSALATARAFIRAAVLREDLGRAWQLSAPALKAASTRRSWLSGAIPVVPYPANAFGHASFKVVRARRRDLLFLVQIGPKQGTAVPGYDYFIELVPVAGRWLVSYWAPRGHTGAIPAIP
jgi:hypothetical protein